MRHLGGTVLVGLLIGLVPAAPVAADDGLLDRFDNAERTSSVTIHGRAYGHGHGLSQYGAYFRGKAGQGYREILDFYYPGTELGQAGGTVRVLLTGDTSSDVMVLDRKGLTVTAPGRGKTWRPAKAAKRWRITPTGDGLGSVISYKTRSWRQWRTVAGEAEFGAGGKPLTLLTPNGRVDYRGVLRSAVPTAGGAERDTVNVLKLDAYLKGVVPSEVIASVWPAETIRAQSVAARTYAAYERDHAPAARHYEICDTARCQVYGGYSAEYPTSNDAVRATAHEVVTHGGEPAFAQFSASNGGHSVAGPFEYLVAQPDPFDHYDPDGRGGDGWTSEVSSVDIEVAYNIENLTAISIETRDGNGEWGGRAETISLTTAKGGVYVVTGDSFRRNLGLRSTYFTITGVTETP